MKKLFSILTAVILLLFFFVSSQATMRRVGFFGPPIAGVDYSTFSSAYTAAAAGDTILMMPKSSLDGSSVSKRLIIIGPGYFLDPANITTPGNAGLQADPNSTSGYLYFYPGSDNSQVLGCSFYPYFFGGNNILIKRCNITSSSYFYSSCDGITFQQCFIYQIFSANSTNICTNVSILNSIIPYNIGMNNGTSSGIINNCIFLASYDQNFGSGTWLIQNSIANGGSFTGTNLVFSNDIGTATQFPIGNGNQQNKPWATIFELAGSYDGQYALRSGSPAIAAGTNGVDCGVFGGNAPYRLSGIPPIPTIYSLSSPQGTTPPGNTIQINLSTRSNN